MPGRLPGPGSSSPSRPADNEQPSTLQTGGRPPGSHHMVPLTPSSCNLPCAPRSMAGSPHHPKGPERPGLFPEAAQLAGNGGPLASWLPADPMVPGESLPTPHLTCPAHLPCICPSSPPPRSPAPPPACSPALLTCPPTCPPHLPCSWPSPPCSPALLTCPHLLSGHAAWGLPPVLSAASHPPKSHPSYLPWTHLSWLIFNNVEISM